MPTEITDDMRRCMDRAPTLRQPEPVKCVCGRKAGPAGLCIDCFLNRDTTKGSILRPTNDHHSSPEIPDPKQRKRAKALEVNHEGEAQGSRLPHICFILRRVSLLDIDSKYHSVKDLLDGVVVAFQLQGDKEGQITLEVRQEKIAHRKDEETIITVDIPDPI